MSAINVATESSQLVQEAKTNELRALVAELKQIVDNQDIEPSS